MKVLIVDFDLFDSVGGGSTIYQNLIKKNSHINFFYFSNKEKLDTSRPLNAFILEWKYYFCKFSDNQYTRQIKTCYRLANRIAYSVKSQFFDVIEIPDYRLMTLFIRPALKRFNVKYEKLVLAMHGNLSTTFELDWESDSNHEIEELKQIEKLQYESVDLRYAISKRYIVEWDKKTKIKAEYVNPLYFIDIPKPKEIRPLNGKPELVFLGRAERRKGPDIFINLLWSLNKSLYKKASIIGPECKCSNNIKSTDILKNLAKKRSIDINFFAEFNNKQKEGIFSAKTLTILPSRYDTLNLLGIEAMLLGNPVAVGNGAGIVDFFDENLKELPYISIDKKNIFSCLKRIKNVLLNYDNYRANLIKKINELKLTSQYFPFEQIYKKHKNANEYTLKYIENIYARLQSLEKSNKSIIINILNLTANFQFMRLTLKFAKKIRAETLKYLFNKKLILIKQCKGNPLIRFFFHVYRYKEFNYLIKKVNKLSESNLILMKEKLAKYFFISKQYNYCRVSTGQEIARLSRFIGNSLVALVYDLRIMKLSGEDKFNRLDLVVLELKKHGFHKEAEVALAMFGKEKNKKEKCLDILNEAYKHHLKCNIAKDYIVFDDNREKNTYRVSIIVSLYNAADKLPLFLSSIEHQSLFEKQEAELIFVETGSTKNDYEVFKSLKQSMNIPMIYAKTSQRETIQSAWNRGISLARGSYLSFLGVDEMIIPSALEILASELDNNSEIDWVQSNTIVTDVDEDGTWKRDVMTYDRDGYMQEFVYLETCYLSWVGALYRKSIHDRFGYYDATFKAAGDTEFKNRILPHIKTKQISKTLGYFLNYPDGQTTNSPIAEIEDLRAWYLHRTIAGIEYAFSKFSLDKLENLFMKSLHYRKSYTKHISTDIEYAYLLLTYIKEKFPQSNILKYEKMIKAHLRNFRFLEVSSLKYFNYGAMILINKIKFYKRQSVNKHINIFNDNRYEQHCTIWQ